MISGLLFALAAMALPSHATVPAAPSPSPVPAFGGTVVLGVCLLSRPAVLETARVGVAATARLKQLAQEAQAEVEAARAPVEADVKALQADAAKLAPAERQHREQALAERVPPCGRSPSSAAARSRRRASRPLLRRLEQAGPTALADHVARPPRLGPTVLIIESWYKAI